MYMEPIVAAKPVASLTQRRLIGTMLVLAGIAAMLPWLALCGTIAAASLGVRALIALPQVFAEAVDHAGDYAHGL